MSTDLKYEKRNIELRRGKVLELSAQGYNQTEISKMLNVSEGLISIDMQFIRAQAKESIRSYIDERLPEEYNKCLVGLSSILKESWTLSANAVDNGEKIAALRLAKDCLNAKLDLLTNVTVVEDVIKFVNKEKETKLENNSNKSDESFVTNVLEDKRLLQKNSNQPEEEEIEEDNANQE
jgi:hypothetical protein